MLSDEQKEELQRILNGSGNIKIIFHIGKNDHTFSETLKNFSTELASLSSSLKIIEKPLNHKTPHFEVQSLDYSGVKYAAIPTEGEWKPFLRTIEAIVKREGLFDKVEKYSFLKDAKFKLETFIIPICPMCAQTVEYVNRLALGFKNIESWIIDAQVFTERATEDKVLSTPTIFLNGEARWVGGIHEDDVLKILKEHNSSSSWSATLKSHILSGAMEEALGTAVSHPDATIILAELINSKEVAPRMNAIRIMEELTEDNPKISELLVGPLCELLKSENPNIRGDAAYALGIIKNKKAIHVLRNHMDDKNEDVKDAVKEAIEELS